ncbi:MAG: spermidine synthase [Alphaproteobacteria bacterium]|nr:spermidine synthase [Alphaproteobacteria bacterium]
MTARPLTTPSSRRNNTGRRVWRRAPGSPPRIRITHATATRDTMTPARQDQLLSSRDPRYRRLFLTSFAILFLELILIRWIPSYVRMLGFFTNYILLASLLGSGVGILTVKASRFSLPSLPILLLCLVGFVVVNQFTFDIHSTNVLFYGAGERAAAHENYYVLPVIVVLVAAVFAPLGAELGRLLASLPPLRAYAVDILGSLAGIASFALLAYLSLQPVIWFGVFACAGWPLIAGKDKRFAAFALAGTLVIVLVAGMPNVWSPYYRIIVTPNETKNGYIISVNNIAHQEAAPFQQREDFYFRAYDLLGQPSFKRVLVIGAGTGTDVAVALAHGAQHVDAVEIDPQLYALGRTLNPDHPYADPRVTMHIDDGRAFLRRTDARYDLIILALTDSLTLTSTHGNLRLESFLYTTEAIRQARAHLSHDGLLVMYNYYRQDWLIQKLASMLDGVFGEPPYVTTYGSWGRAAVFMEGPRLAALSAAYRHPYVEPPAAVPAHIHGALPMIGDGRLVGDPTIAPSSDDWPFVYMVKPALPSIYIFGGMMVIVIALAMIGTMTPAAARRNFGWHFFFLGAAFMLLETRSLVTFALLFGTTWMVNALVFFAILSSVLLAILINARLQLQRTGPLYALLFACLAVSYFVPIGAMLEIGSVPVRYALASAVTFAPIFIANIVFSRSFRDTTHADSAFAANLLGILAGGLLEYAALALGYRALLLLVAAFYGVAMLIARRQRLGAAVPIMPDTATGA